MLVQGVSKPAYGERIKKGGNRPVHAAHACMGVACTATGKVGRVGSTAFSLLAACVWVSTVACTEPGQLPICPEATTAVRRTAWAQRAAHAVMHTAMHSSKSSF